MRSEGAPGLGSSAALRACGRQQAASEASICTEFSNASQVGASGHLESQLWINQIVISLGSIQVSVGK